jgi:hypothetical protein
MAESGWPTSEVMQEHLQNLISEGYMIVVELATCRVPENPASPAPAGGIRRVMRNILREGIWSAVTSISLLAAAVLWLRAASLDSFEDHAYSGLHDPVRGLHGD